MTDYSKPFKVIIAQDCRDSKDYGPMGDLSGKEGICWGLYNPNTGKKAPINGNPYIVVSPEDRIWGMECYWDPAEIARGKSLGQLQFEANSARTRDLENMVTLTVTEIIRD